MIIDGEQTEHRLGLSLAGEETENKTLKLPQLISLP